MSQPECRALRGLDAGESISCRGIHGHYSSELQCRAREDRRVGGQGRPTGRLETIVCTGGRWYRLPRLEVDTAGLNSFPVPGTQASSLKSAAEQPPFGRGPQTLGPIRPELLTDRRFQVEPGRFRLGDDRLPWSRTRPLKASAGHGTGSKRDSTSSWSMRRGLLQAASRHRERTRHVGNVGRHVARRGFRRRVGRASRQSRDRRQNLSKRPAVLPFAASNTDCAHETPQLPAGHRVALVFNPFSRASERLSRPEHRCSRTTCRCYQPISSNG